MATSEHHKYIVVGAGPAGLQMGYFLEQNARDYVILERSASVGAFFRTYPRHRRMISLNKKYNFFEEEEFNWRHDWNSLICDDKELRFTRYSDDLWPSADTFCQYLEDFAERSSLRIRFNTEIVLISRPQGRLFKLSTAGGAEFTCEVLLMGLGTIDPVIPQETEGIELATGYEDMTLDLDAYRNKRVGIIGQGNSAFETADYVAGVAAFVNILAKDPIRFAWNSHYVADLRAINNNIFDMYQLKALHAVLNPRLLKIEQAPDGTLVTTHEYDYPMSAVPGTLRLTREYDVLIRCCGWRWVKKDLFAPEIVPRTWGNNGKYPEMTPHWESVNVPGLYFIGGAMVGNDKKAASAFIHGYRYNIRTLSRMLEERYEGIPYPATAMGSFSWDEIAEYVYNRVSVSAALFQLFGFLCDVIVVDAGNHVTVLQEVPVARVGELDFGDAHVFTVTLEFGFHQYSESAITFLGPSDPNAPECAAFLHPVIRYRRGADTDEFHFGDSLLVRWDRPHGAGGAVMSYHLDFERWVCGKVGIPVSSAAADPAGQGGPFRPWTPEEIAAWQAAAARTDDATPECRNALRTLPAGG